MIDSGPFQVFTMPTPTQQEQQQQPPSPGPFHIAIIGAGITGLTLAIGLYVQSQNSTTSNANDHAISFTVYERAPTLSASAGAGIGLSPNAERAMQLLAPQVHEAYERVANPNGEDWFQWVDGMTDELLFKLHMGKGCFRGCKRAEFLEELVGCLPREKVKFGKCLREVRSATSKGEVGGGGEEDGGVILEFEDGSCEAADAGEYLLHDGFFFLLQISSRTSLPLPLKRRTLIMAILYKIQDNS